MPKTLAALAGRMQALSSIPRLRILLVLRDGALSGCHIAAILGLPHSTLSSHLAELRRAGIVGDKRRGRFVWYSLRRTDRSVAWLRLVARHAVDDPDAGADRERAGRIRLVPPEMVATSTGCVADGPSGASESGRARPRSVRRERSLSDAAT